MLAGVRLTRVHLEEDTARSTHSGGLPAQAGKSLVDFNRAGIPLMELVTEPVINDAETAGKFARELQLLLRALGASEANLEKGEMRIEANVSVSPVEGKFGTKVEVKNLNSFRSVERAITYEIQRQAKLLKEGGVVVQETRGWDETKQQTFHQRNKEGSADYRYFPEPDLPKLFLSEIPEFTREAIRSELPELPWERRARYESLGVKKEYIEIFLQPENEFITGLFEGVAERAPEGDRTLTGLAGNYIVSDLIGLMQSNTESKPPTQPFIPSFFKLMQMIIENKVSSRGAKDILAEMYRSSGDPEAIAKKHGLLQIHDEQALGEFVEKVIADNEKAVGEYKSGKQAALQYLVGKAMKESGGAGNPESLRALFIKKLG